MYFFFSLQLSKMGVYLQFWSQCCLVHHFVGMQDKSREISYTSSGKRAIFNQSALPSHPHLLPEEFISLFRYNRTALACWFPTYLFANTYHFKFLLPLRHRLSSTKELIKRMIWVGTLPYWVTKNTNLSLYESRHIRTFSGITEEVF